MPLAGAMVVENVNNFSVLAVERFFMASKLKPNEKCAGTCGSGVEQHEEKSCQDRDITEQDDNKDLETFENLLERAGGFGSYQILILLALLTPEIPASFIAFSPVFVGARPSSWICAHDDDNRTILFDSKDLCDCNGTIFPTDGHTTFVAEWQLICDKSFVSDFITSIQMVGMLIGSLFSSQLSDWYGRKKLYLAVCVVMAAGQCFSGGAQDPFMYAFGRFLCGAGLSGFMGMSTIYPLEFLTPRWRGLCGSVGPWGEGIMLLAALAYFVRGWRQLLFVSSVPFLLVILCYPFLPESPRWLLRNGRIKEAQEVIRQIHRMNTGQDSSAIVTKELMEQVATLKNCEDSKRMRFTYIDFFVDANLRKKTLFLMGIWFSWALVYFGISYNINNMRGNPYLNVFYLGLADAVGYPCALFVNNRLGRRKSLIFFMCFGSIFLAILAMLDLSYGFSLDSRIVMTLCILGKLGVAGARSAARCLTGESFPTPIRTMGYGISGVTAGVGGILAPQLAYFGAQWWHPLPFVAFAVISIGGSTVSLLLPETADKSLDERMGKRCESGSTQA